MFERQIIKMSELGFDCVRIGLTALAVLNAAGLFYFAGIPDWIVFVILLLDFIVITIFAIAALKTRR